MAYGQGDNIAIRSSELLEPTKEAGLVTDLKAKVSKLTKRVYGATIIIVGILVENSNDRSMGGVNESSSSDNREVSQSLVSNTRDVSRGIMVFQDTDIRTTHATISTTIQE